MYPRKAINASQLEYLSTPVITGISTKSAMLPAGPPATMANISPSNAKANASFHSVPPVSLFPHQMNSPVKAAAIPPKRNKLHHVPSRMGARKLTSATASATPPPSISSRLAILPSFLNHLVPSSCMLAALIRRNTVTKTTIDDNNFIFATFLS